MKKIFMYILAFATVLAMPCLTSCSDDDDDDNGSDKSLTKQEVKKVIENAELELIQKVAFQKDEPAVKGLISLFQLPFHQIDSIMSTNKVLKTAIDLLTSSTCMKEVSDVYTWSKEACEMIHQQGEAGTIVAYYPINLKDSASYNNVMFKMTIASETTERRVINVLLNVDDNKVMDGVIDSKFGANGLPTSINATFNEEKSVVEIIMNDNTSAVSLNVNLAILGSKMASLALDVEGFSFTKITALTGGISSLLNAIDMGNDNVKVQLNLNGIKADVEVTKIIELISGMMSIDTDQVGFAKKQADIINAHVQGSINSATSRLVTLSAASYIEGSENEYDEGMNMLFTYPDATMETLREFWTLESFPQLYPIIGGIFRSF